MERRWILIALVGICLGIIGAALIVSNWIGRWSIADWLANDADLDDASLSKLVYLREEEGRVNLWLDQGSRDPIALTDEPIGIWDYTIAEGGQRILLSSVAPDGSDDLVLVEVDSHRRTVVVDCQGVACREAHWQPNGHLIAYEAHPVTGDGPAVVWLLDTENGHRWPAFSLEFQKQARIDDHASRHPRWSADGRYLSFYLPAARAIVVVQVEAGDPPVLVPANLDLMGNWSPVDLHLAYTELTFGESEPHTHEDDSGNLIQHDETSLFSHVVVTDMATGNTVDVSDKSEFDDGLPEWQPDGLGLVVARTDIGAGRQLWLYAFESQAWRPLTEEPFFDHTAPAWSQDGRFIAFMRLPISNDFQPSVWLYDQESDKSHEVMDGAFLPGWLE